MIEKLDEQYADSGGEGTRFDSAMGIVTAQAGCVKCHVYGDYVPGGSMAGTASRAGNTAPNLANVGQRLRRDYIRPWIANPSRILPYTPMNAVIPHNNPAMWEKSYKGSPEEQLDGVVDLLMNYGRYTASKSSIKEKVNAAAQASPPANTAAAAQ